MGAALRSFMANQQVTGHTEPGSPQVKPPFYRLRAAVLVFER